MSGERRLALTAEAVAELGRCIGRDGVAVVPTDTLYGLCCDPLSARAVERMYALKGRRPEKPSAVMFFRVEEALAALPEAGPRTHAAIAALLPGPVTVVAANPGGRFPLAGGGPGLGVRVPLADGRLAPLADWRGPLLQTSANPAGGQDPRRLEQVPRDLLAGADLVLDAGELPGAPSTVVDLSRYEETGEWSILRAGALSAAGVEAAIAASSAGR